MITFLGSSMGVGNVSEMVWPELEVGLASLLSLASTLRLVGLAIAILSRRSDTEISLSVSLLEL